MSGLFDQITNYSPPLLTAGQVNYKGTWNAATNSPTLVSPPASTSKGDYYVVSAAGTQFGISFAVGDWIISNGTAWEKVDLTDAVSSVFGRTGAITAASGDYTASQVTNVPAGTISSTNVQDAINELSSDIATAQNVLDAYVTNAESVAITKGQVVYAFGATGNRMSVKLANNSADATSAKTVGVVLDSSIAAGNPGYIRMVGVVDGLNLGTFTDGDTLYLGATNGSVTATKPYAPNHLVYVGIVERANNGNGQLYVRVQNGYELDEIHDVQITSAPASGALLVRDATNSLWKAARLTAGTNIAVTNADASVTVGVTGIIGSSNGGTGNGFTKFSGPTTSEKTFTLPNSNATLLYDGGALGTPSSGTVTNLTGTASININGTVGATTANTGAFTTLSASDNSSVTKSTNGGTSFSVSNINTGTSAFAAYYLTNSLSTSRASVTLSGGSYTSVVGWDVQDSLDITNNGAGGVSIVSRAGGSSSIRNYIGDGTAAITTVSSTGLAVTGTLGASGNITASGIGADGTGVFGLAGTAHRFSLQRYDTINAGAALLSAYGNVGIMAGATSTSTSGTLVATFTSSGNVGIGVTPSAWGSDYKAIQIGASATGAFSYKNFVTSLSQNVYSTNANDIALVNGNAAKYELNGSGQHVWKTAAATAGNAISFTQAMTLDASGYLGLGDTSPSSNGKISSIIPSVGSYTGQTAAWYGSNGTGSMRLWIANLAYAGVGANEPWLHSYQNINIGSDANIAIKFLSGGERARIDSNGTFLVGVTAAGCASAGVVNAIGYAAKAGSSGAFSGNMFNINWTGNPYLWIDNTNVGQIATVSDYRIKKNVTTQTASGLERVMQLRPVSYEFTDYKELFKADGITREGFIAHEVQEIIPSGVQGAKDEENQIQSLRVDAILSVTVKAIQELNANLVAQVAALSQRVAALESK